MALGFGFNKAKVLATAEKFVQQGKLQNAIAEYEKIVKEDPKDLTVLNTLGDLCARIGQNEQASQHFKKVGDHYAQDGFTVKAIAVYKKLTRLSPGNFENVNRLAELYTQQGLFSDARAQYMQVADHLLKSGDNNQAAKVFQKILELDPENTATQSKLADLYLKLGKKAEACKIYYTAAESLYTRSSFDAADEALGRVLAIEPENGAALLLRGMIAADAGDSASAIRHLERVADLDSRPDGLRALLRAKLHSGAMDGAESTASKLATVHNDLNGISALAQWYVGNTQVAKALKLYDNYSDRFLAGDRAAFEASILPLVNRVKDDPEALNTMSRLLQRVGDTSHSAEILELQAHSCAQKRDFKAARDLYKKLAELEPDNPLHNQNYKQMLAKLGEDPTTRTLSPAEASQAFMVEELDQAGPVVHQTYDPPTERAIEAALTDAELFVSYNVPAKAIPPLEAVLPLAPRDVAVNQRLATLYARAARYADAARACQVLSEVYSELGHPTESGRYLEASKNYARRAPASQAAPLSRAVMPIPVQRTEPPLAMPELAVATPAFSEPVAAEPAPPVHDIPHAESPALEVEIPAEQATASVQEFSFDVPDHLLTEAHAATTSIDTQPIAIEETNALSAEAETKTGAVSSEMEFDVSNEWENMLTVETSEPPAQPAAEMEVTTAGQTESAAIETGPDPAAAAAEKIQEAQFYISGQMWEAAKKAILDLTEIAPDASEISDLISAVSAGQARAAAAQSAASVAPPPTSIPAAAGVKPGIAAPPAPLPERPAAAMMEAELPAAEFAIEIDDKQPSALELPVEAEAEAEPMAAEAPELVIEPERELAPPPPPPPKPEPARKAAATRALEEIFRAPVATPPVVPAPTPPVPVQPAAATPTSPAMPRAVPAAASAAPPPASPFLAPQPAAATPAPATRRTAPPPAAVTPTAPVVFATPAAAPTAFSGVALEEPLLEDILVVPVEIEALPAEPPAPVAASPAPVAAAAPIVPIVPPAPIVAPAPPLTPVSSAALSMDSLLDDILDVETIAPAQARAAKQPPSGMAAQAPGLREKPKEKTTEDILTDFISDLEKSDLADFVPRAKPDPVPLARDPVESTIKAAPLEAARTASPLPAPAPVAPVLPLPAASAAPVNGDMRDAESASVLTDILSELQQENPEESAEEDPEVHYNLGIAFKEMGLLDEAIGELQKVCHAMDRGNTFSQPIQAYTWLAQCLVDKGAPEAAVRWYKRALQLPRLDDGSRCAIYYDLALAYEASGDKKSALANLMEVYGSNIDFRDVASRIKALKS